MLVQDSWTSCTREEGHHDILVSHCCCNKLPPTYWLKTTKIIILKFWKSEVQSPTNWTKISVCRSVFILETPGENSGLFLLQAATCILWLLASSSTFKAFSVVSTLLSDFCLTAYIVPDAHPPPSLCPLWLITLEQFKQNRVIPFSRSLI